MSNQQQPTCGQECPGYDKCEWVPDPGDGLACFTTCVPTRETEPAPAPVPSRPALRVINGGRQP